VGAWLLGGLAIETPRGLTAADLHARMADTQYVEEHADIDAALEVSTAKAGSGDRILVFGSFFVAAAALNWAQRNGYFTA